MEDDAVLQAAINAAEIEERNGFVTQLLRDANLEILKQLRQRKASPIDAGDASAAHASAAPSADAAARAVERNGRSAERVDLHRRAVKAVQRCVAERTGRAPFLRLFLQASRVSPPPPRTCPKYICRLQLCATARSQ